MATIPTSMHEMPEVALAQRRGPYPCPALPNKEKSSSSGKKNGEERCRGVETATSMLFESVSKYEVSGGSG
jgi:hypothetical protein